MIKSVYETALYKDAQPKKTPLAAIKSQHLLNTSLAKKEGRS